MKKHNFFVAIIALMAVFVFMGCSQDVPVEQVPEGPQLEQLKKVELSHSSAKPEEKPNPGTEIGLYAKYGSGDKEYADIWYTTDPAIGENVGPDNGIKYNNYSKPTLPNKDSVTFWTRATHQGFAPSDVAVFTFPINNQVKAYTDSACKNEYTPDTRGVYGTDINVYLKAAREKEGKITYTEDGKTWKDYTAGTPVTVVSAASGAEKEVFFQAKFADDNPSTYIFNWTCKAPELLITRVVMGGYNAKIAEITNLTDKEVDLNGVALYHGTYYTNLKGKLPAGKSVLVYDKNLNIEDENVKAGFVEWLDGKTEITSDTANTDVYTNGAKIKAGFYYGDKFGLELKRGDKIIDRAPVLAKYTTYLRYHEENASRYDGWSIVENTDIEDKKGNQKFLLSCTYDNADVIFRADRKSLNIVDGIPTYTLGTYTKDDVVNYGYKEIHWLSSTKITDKDGNIINSYKATKPEMVTFKKANGEEIKVNFLPPTRVDSVYIDLADYGETFRAGGTYISLCFKGEKFVTTKDRFTFNGDGSVERIVDSLVANNKDSEGANKHQYNFKVEKVNDTVIKISSIGYPHAKIQNEFTILGLGGHGQSESKAMPTYKNNPLVRYIDFSDMGNTFRAGGTFISVVVDGNKILTTKDRFTFNGDGSIKLIVDGLVANNAGEPNANKYQWGYTAKKISDYVVEITAPKKFTADKWSVVGLGGHGQSESTAYELKEYVKH